MLRIVGGAFRGRRLKTPPGPHTRPTSDRAREALFNILAPRVAQANAADLFAGSGALGLEAMSRGAAFCLFVERDRAAAAVIRDNIAALGLSGQTRLAVADAVGPRAAGLSGAPFDLVLADPPYGQGFVERLVALAAGPFLAPGGLLVIEHHKAEAPQPPEGLDLADQRKYGKAVLSFLSK